MSHLLSAAFFLGLLIALSTLVELLLRAHWDQMLAALKKQPIPARAEIRVRVTAVRPGFADASPSHS